MTSHGANQVLVKPQRLTRTGHQHNAVAARGQPNADEGIALIQTTGNDAGRTGASKGHQRYLFDHAAGCGHADETILTHVILGQRQDCRNFFITQPLEHIDHRAATGRSAGLRNLVDLEPIQSTAIGKQQNGVVCVCYQQVLHHVLVFQTGRDLTLTATTLCAIFGNRLALGVAITRQRDNHFLWSNQVLGSQ